MLEGAGRSTRASFAILISGWVLRRLAIEVPVVELQRWFFKPLALVRVLAGTMSWAIMSAVSGLFMGLMLVASNPSPYFAVLGLVASALMSCNLLAHEGGTFLALVLLLIYLGGMLIALGFSSSMVHDPYPLTPTDLKVFCLYGFYVVLTFLA